MTNYSSFNSNLILILIECNPSTNYMTQTQNNQINPHFSLAIMYYRTPNVKSFSLYNSKETSGKFMLKSVA